MPRTAIHGRTLYYREPEHTEVVGVVDGQGTLWFEDIPKAEALWNEGCSIGLGDKEGSS